MITRHKVKIKNEFEMPVIGLKITKSKFAYDFCNRGQVHFGNVLNWKNKKICKFGSLDETEGCFCSSEKLELLCNKKIIRNYKNGFNNYYFEDQNVFGCCFYGIKRSDFNIHELTNQGVEHWCCIISDKYYRSFYPNFTQTDYLKMPIFDRPNVLLILDFYKFINQVIEKLVEMGCPRKDIYFGPVHYIIKKHGYIRNGHEVSILMISPESCGSFYKLNDKICLIKLSDRKLKLFKKAKLLKKRIIELSPDIVISFLSYVCIYTWLALKKTNIPYVVSERNDPNQRSIVKQFLLNCSFKKSSGCVFQTQDALKFYEKIVKNNSVVIHNPITLDYLPTSIPTRKNQILFVGRFTDQKNCLMLIDAFNLFLEKYPNYILKMFGSGELEEDIKKEIANKNLQEKVLLFSNSKTWQKDEYNSAMFVLPSKYEGMPNVLGEALCLGIPCVSTDCSIGGPKELKSIFPNQLILSKSCNCNDFLLAMYDCCQVKSYSFGIPDELTTKEISLQWINFLEKILKGANDVR